jgi:cytochrome c553
MIDWKKLALLAALAAVTPLALAAGSASAGKAKAGVCAGCHGPNGISVNPLWPNLAGQHAEYLAKQMKDFRDGRRTDPVMAPMAQGLTDEDIENLAAYYASLKP